MQENANNVSIVLNGTSYFQAKLQEWRDNYQAMKDKMMGPKNKGKSQIKKAPSNVPKKNTTEVPKKEKRKSDGKAEGSKVKKTKKKETQMEVDPPESREDTGGAQKRPHNEEETSK